MVYELYFNKATLSKSFQISLVVQCLRVHLAMKRKQVQLLVGELRPHMLQGDYAHITATTELTCCNYVLQVCVSRACALQQEKPLQ